MDRDAYHDKVVMDRDAYHDKVMMDRDAYHDKVMMLLNDEEVYRKLKKDPSMSAERKMNSMLINFKKRNLLLENLYERLHSSGGHIPLFYGLPKIHKETIPLRPIRTTCLHLWEKLHLMF